MAAFGQRERREWRQAWPLPFVSAIGYAVSVAHIYSAGLFIAPLEEEFGWSRAAITGGLTVISVISVILSPFVGLLIDRVGARRIGLPGIVFYCAAIAALSFAQSALWTWFALWILIAFSSIMVKATVWTSAVASRFDASRGLAMAIALCGAGVGSAVLPILTSWLLEELDWRGAYVALGGIMAAIALPLLIPLFRDARDVVRRAGPDEGAKAVELSGIAFGAALRSPKFLQLALVSTLTVAAMTALIVHFVPILKAAGFGTMDAAKAAGLIGIGSILGRLGTGFLLDRISGSLIGAFAFSLPVIVVFALMSVEASPWLAAPAAFLLGLTLGTEVDVIGYLTSRHFGMRNFGGVFGTIIGLQSVSVGTGPLIGSLIYDSTQSYWWMFIAVLPIFALATILVATLGAYPVLEAPDPALASQH